MFKKICSKKAQNMAEYAIIFGVVIAMAVGISGLIKEAMQDRVISEITKIDDDEAAGSAVFDLTQTDATNRSSQQDINIAQGGALTEDNSLTVGTTSNVDYVASGN